MPAIEKVKIINEFYGGIIRDDRSNIRGAASNIEELDIFSNKDYIQAEQLMSSDSMPASTEIYAHDAGDDDTVYGYGRRTDPTAGTVRIVSTATGGATNPGDFSTLFTSSDTTDLATAVSDLKFFRTQESSNPTHLYYIVGASTTWKLKDYNIGTGAEATETTLTGLNGSFMRPTMKVIFGELFVCNGQYIAKVDKDNTVTEKAFTLPKEWEAVDIIPVSDVAIILARNKNRLVNYCKGFWWDLTTATQFDDSFTIPMGGPCWIDNLQEKIRILCAINGKAKLYQLSGAFPGAVPIELPGIELTSVAAETTLQPISSPKMKSQKDGILYFGLYKTDKTGIYAIGQLDQQKPQALILSKRFDTSDYSLHKPTSLLVHGPNYYASFDDNGTADHSRCESNNSPTRSSNAVYESIWIDDDKPNRDKHLQNVFVMTKQLPASTSLTVSVGSDYATSYTQVNRADGSVYNTTSAVLGKMICKSFANKKAFRTKIAFASSTTNSPKLTAIGFHMVVNEESANK